jgi:chromosomal replication initiator protein
MAALGRALLRDLGNRRFNELVRIVEIAHYDSELVTFLCPCEICRERFEGAYRRRVETLLRELTRRKLTFRCLVSEGLFTANGGRRGQNLLCRQHIGASSDHAANRSPKAGRWPEMKFENLLVAPGNELAYKACLSLVDTKHENPLLRPLLIWGPAGSGKTHLLNAVWARASSLKPPTNVVAAAMPDFVRQYSLAVKTSRQESFRQKFRTAGLLLLDDIHLVPDTDAIQDELTNTVDTLHEGQKKMMFTSRIHPSNIRHLRKRLRSRLCACIDVRIAAREGLSSPILSERHTGRLEAAGALAPRTGRRRGAVAEKAGAVQPRRQAGSKAAELSLGSDRLHGIWTEDIERLVGSHFGVRMADIRSSSKRSAITTARHLCYWLARDLMGLTWRDISSSFGERNYSNVVMACKRLGARLEKDDALKNAALSLREKLICLRDCFGAPGC